MSAINDDVASGGEGHNSWEELGHKMFSKDHVRFHTQIDHPDAMTFLDSTQKYVAANISPSAGKYMKGYLDDYRDNMVAYKRERAKETERMVEANNNAEREAKSLKNIVTGVNR